MVVVGREGVECLALELVHRRPFQPLDVLRIHEAFGTIEALKVPQSALLVVVKARQLPQLSAARPLRVHVPITRARPHPILPRRRALHAARAQPPRDCGALPLELVHVDPRCLHVAPRSPHSELLDGPLGLKLERLAAHGVARPTHTLRNQRDRDEAEGALSEGSARDGGGELLGHLAVRVQHLRQRLRRRPRRRAVKRDDDTRIRREPELRDGQRQEERRVERQGGAGRGGGDGTRGHAAQP
mmetsp:Transcript_30518/g.72557  ORF Transcript_30518/g.72557 Transcript_30518/m.72557 type:complete len:243 (+) Transcript_30518:492-1220(+)